MEVIKQEVSQFKAAVIANEIERAEALLVGLKRHIIKFESLPPVNASTPNAEEERAVACEIYEYASINSLNCSDRSLFQRYIGSLKPFYNIFEHTELKFTILGLNLLYLLVENRMSDFHSELELLLDAQMAHPFVVFCTKLEQHLMAGYYDQVLAAASNPPTPYYASFLKLLVETVRCNIGECITSAYRTLSLPEAGKMLMLKDNKETLGHIADNYPSWEVKDDVVHIFPSNMGGVASDKVPALKLVSQVLSYATELERIV